MASNEDGQGSGAPGDLKGVTFLGRHNDAGGSTSYHIKGPSGTVEGPYPAVDIRDRIASGDLSGDEGVSKDGNFWIPILAVPEFSEVFKARAGGAPPSGGGAPGGTQRLGSVPPPPPRPAGAPQMPSAPAPLESSGLGVTSDSAVSRMASGAWASLPGRDYESGDVSVAKAAMPDPNALSAVSGVRRLSPGDEDPNLSELPLPGGFTNLPNDGSGAFGDPSQKRRDYGDEPTAKLSADALSNLGASLPPPPGPPSRSTGTFGLATDPALPTSAAELPGTRPELPRSAAQLPGRAADLPQSAASLAGLGGLPTTPQLPRSATDLPQRGQATSVPYGGGPQVHGTQMMSGITDAELPMPAGGGGFDFGGEGELPASAGSAGSILDELGEPDDIWASPGGMVPGQAQTSEMPQHNTGGATMDGDPFDFGPDPFGDAEDAFGGGVTSGRTSDFSEFFEQGSGGHSAAHPAAPASAPPPPTPTAATAAPAPSSSGGGVMSKVIPAVLGLVILAAGAFAAWTFLKKGQGDETPMAGGDGSGSQVVVASSADVQPISALAQGSHATYVEYTDTARQAVAGGGTVENRARLQIGLALILADAPGDIDVAAEMRRLHESLADQDADSLVALANTAYFAAMGDEQALQAARGVSDPAHAGFADLMEGLYYVQSYRGVDYDEPEADEPAEEEAAGDGSGDEAAAEGGDAEAPAEEEEAPADEIVLDEGPRELAPEAAQAFDAAIAADPGLVPAYYWRGWTALEASDGQTAQRYFEQALEVNEAHVGSLNGVARALLKEGALAEADERIQRVIDELEEVSSSFERSETFLVAAEISIARLQPELAIESLLSSLQANPRNTQALAMLGEQFYQAGQYQRAVEYFQSNADLGADDPEAALGLIKSLIGLGDLDEAQTELEAALQNFPSDARFPYFLGRVYEERGEFEQATELYQRSRQIEPTFLRPYVRLAQLAERSNDSAQAMRLLNEAWDQGIDSAVMANEIGETYLRIGETNRAVTAFRRALEIDQSHPEARINLTDYFLQTGQGERALEELREMLDSGVDSPRVRYLHAGALNTQGLYERAIEEMLALIEADPDNADYLQLLGVVYFDSGDYTAAKERFDQAFAEDPTRQESLYYIGRCDIELGNYNDAISSLTTASQRSNSGEYHFWLGFALERGAQATQALNEYSQVIDDDVEWALENPQVFYRRGRLLYLRGALTQAYRDLRASLTLDRDNPLAAWTMAQVYYEQREFDEAIAMMDRSLSLDSNQPIVHYYAGLAWLNRNEPNLETAVAHLELARDGNIAREYPQVNQTLGYAYRDLGQRNEAIASLQEFLEWDGLAPSERRETENNIRNLGGTP